jgi:hypothetical protein
VNKPVTSELSHEAFVDTTADAHVPTVSSSAVAAVTNFLLPRKVDVRSGDYHVILQKR